MRASSWCGDFEATTAVELDGSADIAKALEGGQFGDVQIDGNGIVARAVKDGAIVFAHTKQEPTDAALDKSE
jgi:hypothetical protein